MPSSWERPSWNTQRGKTPSFSSSLLESIYNSIDEPHGRHEQSFIIRNNSAEPGREITSLRRAIRVEKWMENHMRHVNSDSNSSTDSMASIFSSSETESSVSRSSRKPKTCQEKTRTSSIMNIYDDLKKTKQPISPGRRICNFLNSIFSSKNKHREEEDEETGECRSVRKTRSMKASASASSCLSITASSKSKRSVRFCPVNVILSRDGDRHYPHGHFIKNDGVNSFRDFEVMKNSKGVRGKYDDDVRSCASSDLFELENIGGNAAGHCDDARRDDELPVYGTTSLKINHAIASGLFM